MSPKYMHSKENHFPKNMEAFINAMSYRQFFSVSTFQSHSRNSHTGTLKESNRQLVKFLKQNFH